MLREKEESRAEFLICCDVRLLMVVNKLAFPLSSLRLNQHELSPQAWSMPGAWTKLKSRGIGLRREMRVEGNDCLGQSGYLASRGNNLIPSLLWFNCRLLLLKGQNTEQIKNNIDSRGLV